MTIAMYYCVMIEGTCKCIVEYSDSADEDGKVDEINQVSYENKNYVCVESNNQEVMSFNKEEFDINESLVKIENDCVDEERKIDEINQDSNQSQKNSLCNKSDNQDVFVIIKQEVDIEETCLNIENNSNNEEQTIDENNQHLNVLASDDNNETIPTDNKMNNYDDDDSDKHYLDVTEDRTDVEPFTSIIDADNDIEVVYVEEYNESLECQKKGKSKQSHECNFCNKKFTRSGDLKKHIMTHTGERPHQCNFCASKFTQKVHLKKHLLIHTGEKPYKCNICDKKFRRKEYMKQHLLIHTGEKPHLCNICDKTFTLYGDLKKHLLIHTGEKRHQCNFCDKKFKLKEHLKHHLLIHTGEKPHQCNFCNKQFRRKDYLKQHLLTHSGRNFKPTTKM